MSQRAIGIFDSGVGGLTVLREVRKLLPDEQLIYFGDTARVPYGTKSPATVERYALEAADFLVSRGVKMLVVACNTASAVALPALKGRFKLPVIGVIEPGAQRAVRSSRNRHIGVIGTEGTIKSDAYFRALRMLDARVDVSSVACPLFVPLAEEGWAEHEVARLVAREYLESLVRADIDTLVLGCTHYPLLKATLGEVLGGGVELVDSAEETAFAVVSQLKEHALERHGEGGAPQFFVSDVPTRFERVGSHFLGQSLGEVTQVAVG